MPTIHLHPIIYNLGYSLTEADKPGERVLYIMAQEFDGTTYPVNTGNLRERYHIYIHSRETIAIAGEFFRPESYELGKGSFDVYVKDSVFQFAWNLLVNEKPIKIDIGVTKYQKFSKKEQDLIVFGNISFETMNERPGENEN